MSTKATALVSKELNGPFTLETISVGDIQADEALVEIHASGVCHTDLSIVDGTLPGQFPCVLGHEGAGVVQAVGSNIKDLQKGDKVLLSFASCDTCPECKSTHPAYCHNFMAANFGQLRTSDGTSALSSDGGERVFSNFFGQSSFASHAVVHKTSIVKVPQDTDLALFAPLGCGMQTGSGCVFNTLDVKKGSTVAVFGVGPVGMACIMAAKVREAKEIIAIDLQDSRLELAKKFGATQTINGKAGDVVEQIQKLAPPNGVNYAVDCTGAVPAIENMVQCLGTRGRCATVGAPSPGVKVGVDVLTHLLLGREYVGCAEGDSDRFIPYLMELHKKGQYPLEQIITTYPAKDHEKAIADVKAGKTIKAVLTWK